MEKLLKSLKLIKIILVSHGPDVTKIKWNIIESLNLSNKNSFRMKLSADYKKIIEKSIVLEEWRKILAPSVGN